MSQNARPVPKNGWSELHDLWNDFNDKIKTFRDKYIKRHEDGTPENLDQALSEGVNQVEANCRYTFQMLVMATYFESSFKCFGVDASVNVPSLGGNETTFTKKKKTLLPMHFPLKASSLPSSSSSDAHTERHLQQQRMMMMMGSLSRTSVSDLTTPSSHLCKDDEFGLLSSESSFSDSDDFQTDLLAQDYYSSPSQKSADQDPTQLPSLSELSGTEAGLLLERMGDQQRDEYEASGFVDLIRHCHSHSAVHTVSTSSSPMLQTSAIQDDEAVFKRFKSDSAGIPSQKFSFNSPSMSSLSTTAMTQQQQQVVVRFPLKSCVNLSSPVVKGTSEEAKYAQSIKRKDLLDAINGFAANFGLEPINRRDPIWTSWFLGVFLNVSPEDRHQGRPLLVLDKRSNSTMKEAVSKLYVKMFPSAITTTAVATAAPQYQPVPLSRRKVTMSVSTPTTLRYTASLSPSMSKSDSSVVTVVRQAYVPVVN